MTVDPGRRPHNTIGRKRDEDLTTAILQAAGELLLQVGFDKLRIQDVAERAGAGRGSIYRRWPTKEALLAEAIRAMPDYEPDVTDDPVADLRAIVTRQCVAAADKPDRVPGLISAMRSNPDIDDAVKAGINVDHFRNAIARIIGPDHPYVDLLTDLTPAITLHRSAFTPETLDPQATADEIVSLIQTIANHPTP